MTQTPPNLNVTAKIMWTALLASQIIFLIIPHIVPQTTEGPGHDNSQILFVIGLITLAVSFLLPQYLLKQNLPKENNPATQKGLWFTAFIVSLALNEVPSLLGFLMLFVYKNTQLSYIMFAISIGTFLTRFPTDDKIEQQIQKAKMN